MINKNFKRDWKYGGEVNIIDCKHFSLDFNKEGIGFSFIIEPFFRLLYIQILNLAIRFY